jgi:alpha-tubulin suppressor-like RCC1 family protein
MFFQCTLIVVCSLFVTEEGARYSCGWGADGQTGLGHYNNTDRVSRCVGDIQGVKIVKVSCAADCVLALSGNFVDSPPFSKILKSFSVRTMFTLSY